MKNGHNPTPLGEKIASLRVQYGLRQADVHRATGLSQGYLSQLESGKVKNPSARVLLRLAEALNVNSNVLFRAAGYPVLKDLEKSYDDIIDPEVLRYFGMMSRQQQRDTLAALKTLNVSAPVYSPDLNGAEPIRKL